MTTGDGRATLKDVARIAGVSRSTASRVLNDHPSVRPEVRERVLAAMADVGYVRDELARSLRSGTSHVIALVIPRPPATVFGDAYFATLVAAVVAAGARHHRTVAIVLEGEPGDRGGRGPSDGESQFGSFAELSRRLSAGGLFDGVVLAASVDLATLPDELAAHGLPLVVVGDPDRSGVCSVDVDNEAGGRMAAEHLLTIGRRRIALLGGPVANASARSRQAGARAALADAGSAPAWDAVADDFSVRAGRVLAESLLAEGGVLPGDRVTGQWAGADGIVAGSDAIAAGALEALVAAGLRVPEDVAVVGFDDLPPARTTSPPLTTVRQDIEQVAADAVTRLVELVEDASSEPGSRLVSSVELVVRGSTVGARPAAPAA